MTAADRIAAEFGARQVQGLGRQLAAFQAFNERAARVSRGLRAINADADRLAEVFRQLGLVGWKPGDSDE